MREIPTAMNFTIVDNILYQQLNVKKLSLDGDCSLLTKKGSYDTYRGQFELHPQESWRRLITVDETWIHRYTLEIKERSKHGLAVECRQKKG